MLLDVRQLSVAIGGLTLLDNLAFSLVKGKILGLVGESGSGKSLTAMAIAGLLPLVGGRIASGSILFDGRDLAILSERQFRHLRGRRIAFITQNPMTALDPLHRVGGQIDIVSRLHLGLPAAEARKRTIELLTRLRIADPPTVCNAFPHQLSGGMKQRAVIAMALAGEPDLIVADEPTTALDVTVQMQIIRLLEAQVRERGLALILITHDMGVVAQLCDEVAVLYCGRMAEFRPVQPLFAAPRHPYTRALIACIPRDDMAPGELAGIPGAVPSALDYPPGCRFAPRCNSAQPLCLAQAPELIASADGAIACHFPLEERHV